MSTTGNLANSSPPTKGVSRSALIHPKTITVDGLSVRYAEGLRTRMSDCAVLMLKCWRRLSTLCRSYRSGLPESVDFDRMKEAVAKVQDAMPRQSVTPEASACSCSADAPTDVAHPPRRQAGHRREFLCRRLPLYRKVHFVHREIGQHLCHNRIDPAQQMYRQSQTKGVLADWAELKLEVKVSPLRS